MKKYKGLCILIMLLMCNFTNALAGEWSEEEERRYVEEQKAIDLAYDEFNKKGIAYQLWLRPIRERSTCSKDISFPNEGIRGYYCKIKSFVTYQQIEELSGFKIFNSGPHKDGKINLATNAEFGHYNPGFLTWARNNLIPARSDKAFLDFTKKYYFDELSHAVRSYYGIALLLLENPELKNELIEQYKTVIKESKYYRFYDRGYEFVQDHMPPEMYFMKSHHPHYPDNSIDIGGGVGVKALYFWLRRDMDGTFNQFLQINEDILRLYDEAFLNDFNHIKDIQIYYRLAKSLETHFVKSDLKKLGAFQLQLLRNAIFARRGYQFKNEKLQKYFSRNMHLFCMNGGCMSSSSGYSDNLLTEIDKANLAAIKEYEK